MLAFAAVVAVFHALPAAVGQVVVTPAHGRGSRLPVGVGDLVDLVTPLAVVGAAVVVLVALRAGVAAAAWAGVFAVLYVDGHGIHLAGNSINVRGPVGDAERAAYFWDERLGHIEWHLGWLGLLATLALAEKRRAPLRPLLAAATIVVLGGSLAGATIEGQTWWLVLAAAPVFAVVAAQRRGHVAITCAGGVVAAALAIGAWALWWQGVPQLTEVFSAAPT